MIPEFMKYLNDRKWCQQKAQEHNKLDCLDDVSWECFKKAYIISQISTWETVLITGPNGVGKSGYSELMWKENPLSKGRSGNLIPVNCAALTDNLVQSELFGHAKWSYTGANKEREGKIMEAHKKDNGCLFLDEIGDLSMTAQTMLLRFFQDGEIQPVGDDNVTKLKNPDTNKIELKVICATNKNLEEEIEKGCFREDLYNRINKYKGVIPPLKDRPKDCYQNAQNFLNKFKKNNADTANASWINELSISENFDNDNRKNKYGWGGNFRELENRIHLAIINNVPIGKTVIEFNDLFPEGIRAAKKADSESIEPNLSKFGFPSLTDPTLKSFDLEACTLKLKKAYIDKALDQEKQQNNAAKLLGYNTAVKMMRVNGKKD